MAASIARTLKSGVVQGKSLQNLANLTHTGNSKRLGSTYKAAVLNEFKQPLKIEDKKIKKLKKGEIRVQVGCCAVNASDLLICNGQYEVVPKMPFVPGYELAGEVLEVGSDVSKDVADVGDSVIGLAKESFSGFAQQCVIDQTDVWRVPAASNCQPWCALPDSYATALLGISRRGRVKQGETVVVTAAAGGLGLAAVDIAANVYKAKVIAVCETEDRASLVRDKGAWSALTFNPKEVCKKVHEVTSGKGARLVFDSVGGSTFEEMLKCVCHEGCVIVAGVASRTVPHVNTRVLLPNSFSLIGVSLRNYRHTAFKVYRQVVQDAIDMHDQGLVSPHVSNTFSLDHVNDAMAYLASQKSTGKVLVTMGDK